MCPLNQGRVMGTSDPAQTNGGVSTSTFSFSIPQKKKSWIKETGHGICKNHPAVSGPMFTDWRLCWGCPEFDLKNDWWQIWDFIHFSVFAHTHCIHASAYENHSYCPTRKPVIRWVAPSYRDVDTAPPSLTALASTQCWPPGLARKSAG